MSKLIITVGLPASGKTTWARDQIHQGMADLRVNRDDLRAMLYGTTTEPKGHFTQGREKLVRALRDAAIIEGLSRSLIVISDDTNLVASTKHGLENLTSKIPGTDFEVEEKSFLDVPLVTCIERDEKRQYPVGASVIRQMWQEHVKPHLPKVGPEWKIKDFAVICDLDGTLAELNGRNPYDASTCAEDGINFAVLKVLEGAQAHDKEIIFVSGRDEKYREPTEKFLNRCGFHKPFLLFMREGGDTRDDRIVKEEFYRKYIEPTYDVTLVLDDRDKVVDMWRGLGLDCFQVNYGKF